MPPHKDEQFDDVVESRRPGDTRTYRATPRARKLPPKLPSKLPSRNRSHRKIFTATNILRIPKIRRASLYLDPRTVSTPNASTAHQPAPKGTNGARNARNGSTRRPQNQQYLYEEEEQEFELPTRTAGSQRTRSRRAEPPSTPRPVRSPRASVALEPPLAKSCPSAPSSRVDTPFFTWMPQFAQAIAS